MQNFIGKMLLMNKAGDEGGGNAIPPEQDPPATPPATPPSDSPPPAPGEKQYDELGYEIVPKNPVSGDQKPPGDKSKETPPKESEKVEDPATGYEEDIKVDDPPPADPNAPKPPATPPPTELEKKLEGLKGSFAEETKKIITEMKLEGESLDKFISFRMAEQKSFEDWAVKSQNENARQDKLRRHKWQEELKSDTVFGGDKYLINITRTNKILDEYLPELKKELTEAKQMLRPSVMRGLMRLADQMYPDRKLVQGDPPPPPEDKKNDDGKPNDPLAFYQ